jgi:lipopolysaccharide biosynthesis protein
LIEERRPSSALRGLASQAARFVYSRAPLTSGRKLQFKEKLFQAVPIFFRHTKAYKDWLDFTAHQDQANIAHGEREKPDVPNGGENQYLREYVGQLLLSMWQPWPGPDPRYVPLAADSLDAGKLDVKVIAFYLPQFHPIPENDQWWGKGFTEWTNVSKAVPKFLGHYQPRLPGELGFYDLRVKEIQSRQIELAKQYGIHGFCYHHYWFSGRRLLEMPFNQVLANPALDLPFCLCWANENWSRRWDGQEQELLIAQQHSPEDDIAFIRDIEPALRDPRYIRVEGRPLLIVYRVSLFPDARATAQRWRHYCKAAGIGDLFLVAARSFEVTDPRPYGFDAAVQFPPHQTPLYPINDQLGSVDPRYAGNVFDYRQLASAYADMEAEAYPMFRTVTPSWDNAARRPGPGSSTFFHSSPDAYAQWLDKACANAAAGPESQRLVFVNAWNEWGEGAYLEPDRRYGYAHLHATANVLRGYVRAGPASAAAAKSRERFQRRSNVAIVLHLYYEDLLDDLCDALADNVAAFDLFVSVRPDVSEETVTKLLARYPNACVSLVQNRGRDILPFLQTLTVVSELGYDVGCKIHAKKSTYRSDGANIRAELIDVLLGSRTTVEAIVNRFQVDPALGLVLAHGSRPSLTEKFANRDNRGWLDELLPRLGRGEEIGMYNFRFPAGSMFWFRPGALKPLMALGLQAHDFERELGQIDGTLAHAIERLFELSAEVAGYTVTDTQALGHRDEDVPSRVEPAI